MSKNLFGTDGIIQWQPMPQFIADIVQRAQEPATKALSPGANRIQKLVQERLASGVKPVIGPYQRAYLKRRGFSDEHIAQLGTPSGKSKAGSSLTEMIFKELNK